MMNRPLPAKGMVGPFWVVEDAGQPAIIAVTVALSDAEPYGDMLTVDTGTSALVGARAPRCRRVAQGRVTHRAGLVRIRGMAAGEGVV